MAILIHGPQVTYYGTKQELDTLHNLRLDTRLVATDTDDTGSFDGVNVVWASAATGKNSYSLNVDGGDASSTYGGTVSIDGGNSQ
jgi:hypothetical protein